MATMRPLLLAAVVVIAAAAASPPVAAQSRAYLSISVGTPAPYYGHHYRPGYAWVPGHWQATYYGDVWVPDRYVPVPGYGHRKGKHGHGRHGRHDHGGYRYGGYGSYGGAQVIYRSGLDQRVVPRSYYPPGYVSPYGYPRRRLGW